MINAKWRVTINSDRDIRISTVETIWKLLMETLELTLMPFYARARGNYFANHSNETSILPSFSFYDPSKQTSTRRTKKTHESTYAHTYSKK